MAAGIRGLYMHAHLDGLEVEAKSWPSRALMGMVLRNAVSS